MRLKLVFFSCILLLFSLTQFCFGQELIGLTSPSLYNYQLVNLDPTTENITPISSAFYRTNTSESAVDNVQNIYYLRSNAGIDIFDLQTGNLIKSTSNSIYRMELDGSTGNLIGLTSPSLYNYQLVNLDPVTENITPISSVFYSTNTSESAIDSLRNRYYLRSNAGIDIFDLQTGNLIKSTSNPIYRMEVSTQPIVPEPISSLLFITGGTLLAGRRYITTGV